MIGLKLSSCVSSISLLLVISNIDRNVTTIFSFVTSVNNSIKLEGKDFFELLKVQAIFLA